MQSPARIRAIDPRPPRTRAAIYAAVADLTTGRGETVTVNAILQASGVSRSAFYAQFAGLDELLIAMVIDGLRDLGIEYVTGRSDPTKDPAAVARATQERLVGYISERREFFRATLDWRLSFRAYEAIVDAYAEGVRATIAALGESAPRLMNANDTATFIAGGAISLLTAWLREADPGSPPEAVVQRIAAVLPGWLNGDDN